MPRPVASVKTTERVEAAGTGWDVHELTGTRPRYATAYSVPPALLVAVNTPAVPAWPIKLFRNA